MFIYIIYDYPEQNSENIYFHEDMNEKHSILRDTCMLPGGSRKRVRLTVKATHNSNFHKNQF